MILEIQKLYRQNKFIEANLLCEKIAQEKILDFNELLIISTIKTKIGDFIKAIKFAQEAILLKPNNFHGYNTLAICFKESGNFQLAIDNYKKSIEINQNSGELYYNLAVLYEKINELNNAILSYKKSIRLKPNLINSYINLGLIYYRKKLYKKSEIYYNKSLKINSNNATTKWNLSLLFLEQGKFKDGWNYYEYGKKCGARPNPRFEFGKLWTGNEDLKGKKILLYSEQGFGDVFQFCRYIELVYELGGKVIFQTYKELKFILRNLKGIYKILDPSQEIEKFDYYNSIMSLPKVFGTNKKNILNKIPYIFLDNDYTSKWKKNLNFEDVKIGICCNSKKNNSWFRDFDIKYFNKIYRLSNVKLISLEKNSNYKSLFPNIIEFKNLDIKKSFMDTASIINNIDLVITCDTSIAHLSAALGKKTLIALNYKNDWRWGIDENTTIWYPNVILFRNKKENEWENSFENILNYIKNNFKVYEKN